MLIFRFRFPYTIVRATQFFEFVGGIAQLATEGQISPVPPMTISFMVLML